MKAHVCGGLLASAFLAAPAHAELVVNSDFESGLAPWTLLTGEGKAEAERVTDFGHSGTSSIRFGGGPGASTPATLLGPLGSPLLAGQEYKISMWIHNLGVGDDFLQVWTETEQFYSGIVPTGLETWELFEVTFTPSTDSAGIAFFGSDQLASFYIDDISIVAVPGPSAAALLGVAGVLSRRRRR